MKNFLLLSLFLLGSLLFAEGEMRTWRALGGFKTEAAFVKYTAGVVTLKKSDGQVINVRIERLTAADQREIIKLAGENARGALPAGSIQKPTGRRELTWKPIVRGDIWPESMPEDVKSALTGLKRGWSHAETEYFIVHYQQVGFAKQVARMADFQYQYIAADLPGFQDRMKEKSHIVVVRDREDWQEYLGNVDSLQNWFAAYVHGMTMYLYDTDNSKANAHILAHEMSHLVLNRFFVHRPPLWLNEGLAEWYGNVGHSAFKGKKVDVEKGLGEIRSPYSMAALTSMQGYPQGDEEISRFYNTSQQVVGMLMLSKDQPTFVEFLKAITVEGQSFRVPLSEVYNIPDLQTLQRAFDEFLD
ncbi:SHD1 domain-containing protein [Kiritimatiellaeota bacterium B1221]|nr:SHD1 domain-containing protein [Kiritimatiellaeota bacterium B1221]